jgi:hypothetical protein
MVFEELTDWLIRVCKISVGQDNVRIGHSQEYLLPDDADDNEQKPYKVKSSRRIVRESSVGYQYQQRISA